MHLYRSHSDVSMSRRLRQVGRTALSRTQREVSSLRHKLRAWFSSGNGIAKNDMLGLGAVMSRKDVCF